MAQVKMQDIGKVTSAKTGVQSEPGRFFVSNLSRACATARFGMLKCLGNVAQLGAFAHGPKCVNEGQPSPLEPLLTKVEGDGEARQTGLHGPVTDQQYGIYVEIFRSFSVQESDCNFGSVL